MVRFRNQIYNSDQNWNVNENSQSERNKNRNGKYGNTLLKKTDKRITYIWLPQSLMEMGNSSPVEKPTQSPIIRGINIT